MDKFLLDGSVNIKCEAKRSSFHEGLVKFILLIGGEKIRSSVVTFEKDGKHKVETEFHFVAVNEMSGEYFV